MKIIRRIQLILLVAMATFFLHPAQSAERWDREIQAFEQSDAKSAPPTGANLFVGSSSIVLWKNLDSYFPEADVINRGFGGSLLSDVIKYADRIILPYVPSTVLVYGGSHDLHVEKKSPEQVAKEFEQLCNLVQAQLPNTKMCFISMKPSLAKWNKLELDRQANALIREYAEKTPQVEYIDVYSAMCRESTPPPADLFAPDRNHVSAKGYGIWAEVVRPYLIPRKKAE